MQVSARACANLSYFQIIAVHWSPPFEGPLRVPFDDVLPYYAAYKVFHDIIENPGHRKEYRLQEGDTIVFNQRRYWNRSCDWKEMILNFR